MGGTGWFGYNWFALVQAGAIVIALAFTGAGFWFDARSHRVSNLILLTDRHRLLWERVYSDPKLARILDPEADLDREPVTAEEELFMIFFILHLANTFYTVQSGFLKQSEGLARDVQLFLTLPVPKAVWRNVRDLQDRQFVKFVERCLNLSNAGTSPAGNEGLPDSNSGDRPGQGAIGRHRS